MNEPTYCPFTKNTCSSECVFYRKIAVSMPYGYRSNCTLSGLTGNMVFDQGFDSEVELAKYQFDSVKSFAESTEERLESVNSALQDQLDIAMDDIEFAKQQADSAEHLARSTDAGLKAINNSLQAQVDIAKAEAASAKKDAFWSKVFSALSILVAIVIPLIIAA